ncbi:glycoside hydrolase family 2 protein [Promineifilum sp.]|uniref:glycoside hydrolase family 2 protein n=1 Tax=Promineifilum sp. TaxID=2664178 RepID=UPI0035B029B3
MIERIEQSLDGKWEFWVDSGATLAPGRLAAEESRPILVPGPWQAQADDLRTYSGPAWYRRAVEVPADWLAHALILCFGAVDYRAEVWWNGQPAGEHEGGYLPFELDVTAAARPGRNELVVRVADPPELFREIPHGKQSWYGPLSGIWQPVRLECRPATHIRRVRVTPDAATGRVSLRVETSRPLAEGDRIEARFLSPQGAEVATTDHVGAGLKPAPTVQGAEVARTAPTAELNATVAAPELWDIDSPRLYTVEVTLETEASRDMRAETFGFRTIEAREGRLWLNGRPLYLRGALDQDYYPDLIYTPPSYEYIENEFRQAKAMGLNCLRVHIKVADPRYYEAADRVGLLIWTELPNWAQLTDAAIARGRETIAGMIERDWNHPSIIIWTIINEAWGTELATNPDHRAWLAEMYAWVKGLDPTRLVVDNSPCFDNAHVKSDLDDFHFYAAMPDDTAVWDALVGGMADRAPWLYAPDCQTAREDGAPLVISEFGNWGLPDIGPLLAHYGREPWWFETGWEWSGGDVYPHAAGQRFHDLYLDRVFGDYAGLAHASQWAQFEALRYEIETMRLHPPIAGYVITEFTDVHWECNGLLDMLRRPKAHYDRLREINADTMLIPRVARRAWRAGETADVALHLSHFGPRPLRDAALTWSLAGDGVPHAEGTIGGIAAATAQVIPLPPLRLELPDATRPTRLSLWLALADETGQEVARNELPLILFPPATPASRVVACAEERLAGALRQAGYTIAADAAAGAPLVVTTFDQSTRRFVERGGQVLFLAQKPDALQTSVPRLALRARRGTPWSGDWASSFAWYRRDLWAGDIPGDGRFDFAFASVLPETVIDGVHPADFREEVLAGLFVGWLRRPAALVRQLPLGKGTLLVSTLRLRDGLGADPVADKLVGELLSLLSSKQQVSRSVLN